MSLNADQLHQYRDEGYLIFPALLDAAVRDAYLPVFDEMVAHAASLREHQAGYCLAPDEQGRPLPGLLHKVQGVCLADERILGLASEPALLDRVEALVGPNIDMFGSKFFPMMARGGTSTGWHQDNHYFGTNTDRVVSCAIYLEATDTENGCLRVAPGSHRSCALVPHTHGSGNYAHGDWAQVDENRAVDVVCPAGTVVFFSANLLHGARPNLSDRTSYRTAWHYLPGDLALEMFPRGVYRDRHILRGE